MLRLGFHALLPGTTDWAVCARGLLEAGGFEKMAVGVERRNYSGLIVATSPSVPVRGALLVLVAGVGNGSAS